MRLSSLYVLQPPSQPIHSSPPLPSSRPRPVSGDPSMPRGRPQGPAGTSITSSSPARATHHTPTRLPRASSYAHTLSFLHPHFILPTPTLHPSHAHTLTFPSTLVPSSSHSPSYTYNNTFISTSSFHFLQ